MKKLAVFFAVLGVILFAVCVYPFLRMREDRASIAAIEPELSSSEAFFSSEHDLSDNKALLNMLDEDHTKPSEDDTYVFTSPEGIVFHSDCDAWDEKNLEALYNELLLNRHGDELYALSEVIVYPQRDEFAAAAHQQTTRSNEFRLYMPCMPDWPLFKLNENAGIITLYNGENDTTVASMASSLSHEYGHHYTFYYMFNDKKEKEYWDTEYAALRGLTSENSYVDRTSMSKYYERHMEYLVEIAAEDYLNLMGSPNTRRISEYKDVRERLGGAESDEYITENARPQENMLIPMGADVPGLAEYFYGFIGERPPEPLSDRDFNIQLSRHSASYDLTVGRRTYVYYTVTWNKVYGDDAVYTLISLGEDDDNYYPIRTVSGGESASATIGAATSSSSSRVYILDDELARGTRTFKVTAVLPDGRVCVSEPLDYNF